LFGILLKNTNFRMILDAKDWRYHLLNHNDVEILQNCGRRNIIAFLGLTQKLNIK
jgi:hypothetical protein